MQEKCSPCCDDNNSNIGMDNDLSVDVSIPYHVSLKELIDKYDTLLTLANNHACTASKLQVSDTKHLMEIYCALILVCNILLILPIQMAQNQQNLIHSTIRRAILLQKLCATDLDIRSNDDDELKSLKLVQITTIYENPDSCYDIFEWKYESTDHDNNEDYAPNNDNAIPLSMTPEELLEEERMLLQMANTPIPTETIDNDQKETDNDVNSLQHLLYQEWDKAIYDDKSRSITKTLVKNYEYKVGQAS
jgi:hypothetical protein